MLMMKPFTFIYYSVLIKNKSGITSVNTKNEELKKIYSKCTKALNLFTLSPRDKVVNKILKYADL